MCVQPSDPSGSTGSVSGVGTAANPSGRHSGKDGALDVDTPGDTSVVAVEEANTAATLQTEFQKSLELARAALYSRDPKRRAREAAELHAKSSQDSR